MFGKAPAGGAAEGAGVGAELFGEGGVVGGLRHDGDVLEVFGGGADHGGAADVDVLDEFVDMDAGAGCGGLEGIEIDDDHVDRLEAVLGDGGLVLGVDADMEDAAVDLGMQGLDAAVKHLGKAGEIGDVADIQAGLAEGAGRAAGRDELDAEGGEGAGEIDQAGLIGDGDEGATDGLEASGGRLTGGGGLTRGGMVRCGAHRDSLEDLRDGS